MPQLAPDPGTRRKVPRSAYLRSCLPVLGLLLLLSFFLSSLSLLSHFRSPASKQRIGWQAWDSVRLANKQTVEGATNETVVSDEDFVPSIPIDTWDPLAVHTTGITEVAVKSCYFPPYLFPSYCAPKTTPELDKERGKWVIVEKDLNIKTGIWYLNIYYRRTRRQDAFLITGLRVVDEPAPDTLKDELEGWIKAEGDLHSGTWPTQPEKRLWYRVSDASLSHRQAVNTGGAAPITEIDVVYGDNDPFYGFERILGGKVTDAEANRWDSVDIAIKRGQTNIPKAHTPVFNSEGHFKIMQIADLHYSVGSGSCRDTDKEACAGDEDTATWLGQALDAERPDMVVFSGDQLNGQDTSYDSRSVLAKFAKPVIDRQIPWCAIFGNHDSEIVGDRAYQMRTLENMPYSLAQSGPAEVDGVGNYVIKILSSDPSHIHLFTLYFLDSHDYQKRPLPWAKPEYDYIKSSQIDWYLYQSSLIKPIERPFQPDGAADLGDIWLSRSRKRNGAQSRQNRFLAKPNAMMFFHIPLPEAYNEPDVTGYDGDELDIGSQLEGAGNSKHNSGFFYNGVKQAYEVEEDGEEVGDIFGRIKTNEVKVLSHGHCHLTDRCRRSDGIWMCFDGGSSYSGYGQLGFDRRVRLYELSDYGETVETYKRLTSGEIIDKQVLVGSGAAQGVGQDQII